MQKYIIIIAAIIGMAAGSGGTLFIAKMIKPKIEVPPCPPCNCPPAARVDLGNFDMEKINNRKGNFTFAPHFENVTVEMKCDSSVLKKAK